jgi:hypothetical protein
LINLVDPGHDWLSVRRQCELLGVARASFYAHRRKLAAHSADPPSRPVPAAHPPSELSSS